MIRYYELGDENGTYGILRTKLSQSQILRTIEAIRKKEDYNTDDLVVLVRKIDAGACLLQITRLNF